MRKATTKARYGNEIRARNVPSESKREEMLGSAAVEFI